MLVNLFSSVRDYDNIENIGRKNICIPINVDIKTYKRVSFGPVDIIV